MQRRIFVRVLRLTNHPNSAGINERFSGTRKYRTDHINYAMVQLGGSGIAGRSKVNHRIGLAGGGHQRVFIAKVALIGFHAALLELLHGFERARQAEYLVAAFLQRSGNRGSDIPGGAGDEYFQDWFSFSIACSRVPSPNVSGIFVASPYSHCSAFKSPDES